MHVFEESIKLLGWSVLILDNLLADFGPVIVDTMVSSAVELYNFGPVPIHLRKMDHSHLKRHGFEIHFPKLTSFPLSAQTSFHVIFNPKSDYYSSREEEVNVVFFLEVSIDCYVC